MIEVERVQTGIRIEKRLLKVLKALAELKDLSVGDLLEGIVLHAFEGKAAFSKETLAQIAELKKSTVWRSAPTTAINSRRGLERPGAPAYARAIFVGRERAIRNRLAAVRRA